MAQRLRYDPNLENPIDPENPTFRNLVLAAIDQGQNEEAAIQQITAVLTALHQDKVRQWNEQVEEDRLNAEAEERERELEEEARREEERKLEEQEKKETAKKRPKLADFDVNKGLGRVSTYECSPYAIERLRGFNYIGLWFFTKEASDELKKLRNAPVEDALAFGKSGGDIVLKSSLGALHAKKMVPDQDLTLRQIITAYPRLVAKMRETGWPSKYSNAMGKFFFFATTHQILEQPHGEETMLRLIGFARRRFHDAIRNPDPDYNEPFNISIIEPQVILDFEAEVLREWNLRQIDESKEFVEEMKADWAKGKERAKRAVEPASESEGDYPRKKKKVSHSNAHQHKANGSSSGSKHGQGHVRPSSSSQQHSFRKKQSSTPLSVCAVCLGRHPHDITTCAEDTLWNGEPAACKRGHKGQLLNAAGKRLCLDYQRTTSCSVASHNHECSGCGKRGHGAHACALAQRA